MNPRPQRKESGDLSPHSKAAVTIVLASGWLMLTGCSDAPPAGRDPGAGEKPLAIVISGDTAGWIVPCGCASNQSGGLLRRGSYVGQLNSTHDVILADAGGAPGGTSEYDRSKFSAILRGELAMGLAAHNLGGPEIALGADFLRKLGRDLRVPFVSANIRDADGRPLAPACRIVTAGGRRVALIGVASPAHVAAGCRIDEPGEAVLAALSEIDGKYDALIVLAHLPEEELRRLAADLPEATAVIGGPTGQSIPPTQIGATVLASATNKGKFLVELTSARGPRQQATAGAPEWSGRVVEISDDFSDDAGQRRILDDWRGELARRDFAAHETDFAQDLAATAPAGYRLAGSAACRDCHARDDDLWHASGHAHAWSTLAAGGAHRDSYCQQCHTTGYGLPGGFVSIAASPERMNVGCESCHGPSAAHVASPERNRTPFAARELCVTCHDRENDPDFDYASHWERIRHGASYADEGATP